jgi:KDO2-lipid IV(A) lauroyltransferase
MGKLDTDKLHSFQIFGCLYADKNKIFERLFYKLRTRNGAIFLKATTMREEFLPYKNSHYLLGLIADQSPGHPGNAWWFNFFSKPNSVFKRSGEGCYIK